MVKNLTKERNPGKIIVLKVSYIYFYNGRNQNIHENKSFLVYFNWKAGGKYECHLQRGCCTLYRNNLTQAPIYISEKYVFSSIMGEKLSPILLFYCRKSPRTSFSSRFKMKSRRWFHISQSANILTAITERRHPILYLKELFWAQFWVDNFEKDQEQIQKSDEQSWRNKTFPKKDLFQVYFQRIGGSVIAMSAYAHYTTAIT